MKALVGIALLVLLALLLKAETNQGAIDKAQCVPLYSNTGFECCKALEEDQNGSE